MLAVIKNSSLNYSALLNPKEPKFSKKIKKKTYDAKKSGGV
jgi:hypothetical protein